MWRFDSEGRFVEGSILGDIDLDLALSGERDGEERDDEGDDDGDDGGGGVPSSCSGEVDILGMTHFDDASVSICSITTETQWTRVRFFFLKFLTFA